MVLKEVTIDFTSLYICVSIVWEKPIHCSLFTIVCKVQHCTGYPLIQAKIVSVCESHYMCWVASQSSGVLTFLILECVVILWLSPVWVQVQVVQVVQVQVCLLQVQECLLRFPPFFLKYRIRNRGSIWFCQVDKVRWKFLDRIVPDKVSIIIISRWGLKLSFFCFCESAVFLYDTSPPANPSSPYMVYICP